MVWLQFLFSSAVLVFTAKKLAEYGDIIAIRTKLGGLFIAPCSWQVRHRFRSF